MTHRSRLRALVAAAVAALTLLGGLSLPPSAAAAAGASTLSFTTPLVFTNPAGGFVAYRAGPTTGFWKQRSFGATNHATYAAAAAAADAVTLPDPGGAAAHVRLSGGDCVMPFGGTGRGPTLSASPKYCWVSENTWSVTTEGRVVFSIKSKAMGPTQPADKSEWPYSGLRPLLVGGGYPLADPRFELAPLLVRVDRVNDIARTAVLGGTATKGAEIRAQGRQTTADSTTGVWSITVTGLGVGVTRIPVTQRVGGTDRDTETAVVTITDGGTVVPAPTSRVDLTRGGRTDVPFIVQNRKARSNMVGVVELTAPEGSTFSPQQTTVAAETNRSGEGSPWTPNPRLDLENGRLGADGRTLVFDLASGADSLAEGEYHRYTLSVDTPAAAAPIDSSMSYVHRGDSSAGDYRAAGRTATTVVGSAPIETTIGGTVPGNATGWGRSDIRTAAAQGPLTLTAPTGSRFADVEARRTADDAPRSDYRVTHSADRRTATINGPDAETEASWGADDQYAAFRLVLDDDLPPGTALTGGTVQVTAPSGSTVAEGVFDVPVDPHSLSATPGESTVLTRGDRTAVEFGATATAELTNVDGRFELTAPTGTTFERGQDTLDGQYRHQGADWTDGGDPLRLTEGERSADGRTYSYRYAGTSPTYRLFEGSRLRWSIGVQTPSDADTGSDELRFTAVGATSGTDFRIAGATPVVVDESAPSLTAEVTLDDDVTTPATIGGLGDEDGTVTVREGGALLGEAPVVSGGWSMPIPPAVGPGEHTFEVTQTVGGRPFGSVRASVDLGAAVDVEEPANGKIVPGRTTVRGTGAPRAEITVTAGDRTATTTVAADGTWEARVEIDPGHSVVPITASQQARGGVVTTDTAQVVPDAPQELRDVVITEPSSHFYTPLVDTTVRGTATPYATVEIRAQWGFVLATAEADADGAWAFDRVFGPSARYELTAGQTLFDGRKSSSPVFELYADGSFVPIVVTSHADGGTYVPGSVTFTGRATQGAYIEARNQYDRVLFSTRASQVAGAWSATTALGPIATYDVTVSQKAPDGTTSRTSLQLSPELAFVDLEVTSHTDGQTYRPGTVTFSGAGTPTGRVVATNQFGAPMGEAVVGADGTWSFSRELGPDADYELTFTQTFRGEEDSVILRLLAPVWQPLAMTSPAVGDRYTPGEPTEFTGTATPYSTITATTAAGNVLFSVETGGDGVWRSTRPYGPDNVYRIDIGQQARNGRTDALETFVWAPELPWAPLTVTSHVDGETYRPGELELRGTGAPGAVVEITNQWDTVIGRPVVAGDGTWTLRRAFGPTADYVLRLVMTRYDQTDEIERFELRAPVWTEIVLIDPAPGEGYTEGRSYTMRGRATPFATVRATTALGGQLFETTADRQGDWSNTRLYGPAYVYQIDLTQEAVTGETGDYPRFPFGPSVDTIESTSQPKEHR